MVDINEVKRVLKMIDDAFEDFKENNEEEFEVYPDIEDYAIIQAALKELIDNRK
jgi:hypothetical protein